MGKSSTEKVRCDHIPCGCYVDRDRAVAEGGGLYCSKRCAKHPFTGNKCACGHPECR
jgi:hypothetical protein